MESVEERNLEVVQRYLAHVANSDIEDALALCRDDATFRGPDGRPTDKAGLRAMFAQIAPLMPNKLAIEIIGTTCQGHRVAVEATGETELANGNTYANIYHFLFEVEDDGQITASREYCDTTRASAFEG